MTRSSHRVASRRQQASTDAEVTRALDALRRILQALRRSAGVAEARAGVTGAQLFVLQALATGPGSSVNDLAQHTFTHQSTVSVVVERLVRRGLVRKRRAAHDRRRVELRLTARGEALMQGAPVSAQARLIAGIQALPTWRVRELAELLETLVAALGAEHEAARLLFETPVGGEEGRGAGRVPGRAVARRS